MYVLKADIAPIEHYFHKRLKGKPTLVHFSADFCPPCKTLKKNELSRIEQAYGEKIQIFVIDIEDDAGDKLYWHYAKPLGVRGMPFLVGFNDKGQSLGYVSGNRPKKIRELVTLMFQKENSNPASV